MNPTPGKEIAGTGVAVWITANVASTVCAAVTVVMVYVNVPAGDSTAVTDDPLSLRATRLYPVRGLMVKKALLP